MTPDQPPSPAIAQHNVRNGLLAREDLRQGEEARLHRGVDAAAHPGTSGHRGSVDREHLDFLVEDLRLYIARQGVPYLFGRQWSVQEESRAGHRLFQHVVALEEAEVVDCHESGALSRSWAARA
jgi:hypothetical protein